jgi:hypothetical protein
MSSSSPSNQPEPCICGYDLSTGYRMDILCPVHDKQPEPKKPICPDARAIPPSRGMLKNGKDYYSCSKCGEPCDVVDLKPDAQAELLAFVTDPKTIAKAVEGSMDKRLGVQGGLGLREDPLWLRMKEIAKSYYPYVNHEGDNGPLWNKMLHQLYDTFQADRSAAVREELERLRLPFATDEETLSSDGVHQRPAAQGRNKMKQRIRTFIDAELARLQPPTAMTDQERTEISLCQTCMSVTHTHDGICTRCGEGKPPTAGEGESV